MEELERNGCPRASPLTGLGNYQRIWTAERGGYEVDFLIQREGSILPIEVKSGAHTKAKRLEAYQKSFHPAYSIKRSTRNFGLENGQKSVPLYACFCI